MTALRAASVALLAALCVGCSGSGGATTGATTHETSSSSTGTTPPASGTSIGPSDPDNAYIRPEIAAAQAITGVSYRAEPDHEHVDGVVDYDASPPVGGDHSGYYADCAGTVYPKPIADENAVHMLEHGAVWITYRVGLPARQVAQLASIVRGVDHLALSPYPGLHAPISLQAWDYQLFVDSPGDPRIAQFIAALRENPATTPELGASCSQPTFKEHPSVFGHPLSAPAG